MSVPKDGRYHILVVDDEPLVAEALVGILRLENHDVAAAPDGSSALDAFRQTAFDIVLLDIGMPGMNGYRVAEEMKRLRPQVPVVLVTGWGEEIDHQRVKAARVERVIGKPFRPRELLEIVEGLLELGEDEHREAPVHVREAAGLWPAATLVPDARRKSLNLEASYLTIGRRYMHHHSGRRASR